MSAYIKKSTGEYPFFAEDILENTLDFAPVKETSVPLLEENQVFYEGRPVLTSGEWTQTWVVRHVTDEETREQKIQAIKFMLRDGSIKKEEAVTQVMELGFSQEDAKNRLSSVR